MIDDIVSTDSVGVCEISLPLFMQTANAEGCPALSWDSANVLPSALIPPLSGLPEAGIMVNAPSAATL